MLLITGASGYVGRHFLEKLTDLSPADPAILRNVLPMYHTTHVRSGVSVDLTHAAEVDALLRKNKVSAVIHLAAEARLVECEKDPKTAFNSNVLATRNLLAACRPTLPYFIYVSTDMVFNGQLGDYKESDPPDATSVYGRTKSEAENLVRKYPGVWCIVRPSFIYGAAIEGKASALSWTLETIRSGGGHFFTDEIRTPVWVNDLVALLLELCRVRYQGVIHAGGPDRLSRLNFATLVAETWGLSPELILSAELADDPLHKWRPRNLALVSETAHRLSPFTQTASALQAIRTAETF